MPLPTVPTIAIEQPLIIFGGPYSNREATLALLEAAAGLHVPAERIICTGDVVAYGGDPALTVECVRRAGIHVVRGNCEESLGAGAGDCGCGFAPGTQCDSLSGAWFAHARRELDADACAWMAALPDRIDLLLGDRRIAVIHGSAGAINRFVFASTPVAEKRRALDALAVDGIIGGHCGLPFTQRIGNRLWHNPGAIGMPAHDGTARTWFSVLTPSSEGLKIDHHALDYDHASAARSIRRAGLPEDYARALETGLWPGCDVLPAAEIRDAGKPLESGAVVWDFMETMPARAADRAPPDQLWPLRRPGAQERAKFRDPRRTAKGERRAVVPLQALETLWFNTGTLCNLSCTNCYIESTPRNDRLAYLSREDVSAYLDEIAADALPVREIGLTGGEPFMNPEIIDILEDCLSRGHRTLVLTNAMKPMMRHRTALLGLRVRYGSRLALRISLDHHTAARHEEERGVRSFQPALDGLVWLARNGFDIAVAGRMMWRESEAATRAGFARLFAAHGVDIDVNHPAGLVLFPEMDAEAEVPEITESCWGILGKSPSDIMCASSRMVVRRKGADRPAVLACTLIAYDPQFELGQTLREASQAVPLNHRFCASFCVLGGASCSAGNDHGKAAHEAEETPALGAIA